MHKNYLNLYMIYQTQFHINIKAKKKKKQQDCIDKFGLEKLIAFFYILFFFLCAVLNSVFLF